MDESTIAKIASELVAQQRERASAIQREYLDAEAKARAKKLELNAANSAPDRLKTFRPLVEGKLQCPYCGIFDGVQSSLKIAAYPLGTVDKSKDIFECERCKRF